MVLQAIVYAVTVSMPPDLGDVRLWLPAADWRVPVFLVIAACLLVGRALAQSMARAVPYFASALGCVVLLGLSIAIGTQGKPPYATR